MINLKSIFGNSTRLFYLFLLLILVDACGDKQNHQKNNITVNKIGQFNTSPLAPNSYLVSSRILSLGDSMVYYDKSIERAVIVDSTFKFLAHLTQGMGQGPEQIGIYVSHTVTSNYFVIVGASELIFYNRFKLDLVQKIRIPDLDLKWVVEFNSKLYLAAYSYSEDSYNIFSIQLLNNKLTYTKVLTIPFDDKLDWSIKNTQALVGKEYMFILKSEVGQLVKLDSNMNIVFDKQLPFSIPKEKNYVRLEDGSLDLNFYECRSAEIMDGNLYILRYYDVSEDGQIHKESFRACVQIFNSELDFLGQFYLPEKATGINFYNDQMIAIDFYEELYNKYQIDFKNLSYNAFN